MNEFQNKMIVNEERYQNGFFPKVPKSDKKGSVYILTGGCSNDILVNEYTTPKQIRDGKFTLLVEVSTYPHMQEIRFSCPGKEAYYTFDVYVKAVIEVNDPIVFYQNKNIDVDAYFKNLFFHEVKKITRKYSILEHDGIDEELMQKLSSDITIDGTTGFSYQISAVEATPGAEAKEYTKQLGIQDLNAWMKEHAREKVASYASSYEEAIMTEVAEGKRTEVEAIEMIEKYKKKNYREQMEEMLILYEKGLIRDKKAEEFGTAILKGMGMRNQEKQVEKRLALDAFYTEDERK